METKICKTCEEDRPVDKFRKRLKSSGVKDHTTVIEKVSEIDIMYISPDNETLPISLKFII